jgi:hypothetical protein
MFFIDEQGNKIAVPLSQSRPPVLARSDSCE